MMRERFYAFLIAATVVAASCASAYAEQSPIPKDRDSTALTASQPAAGEAQPAVKLSNEEPAPSGSSKTSSNILEKGRSGYIHPFISITESFNDNIFYTRDNRISDFVTLLSPGIWIALPRLKEREVPVIETATMTPGGLALSSFQTRYPGHFQTYLLYRADIERYSRNSSENTTSHTLDGMFQYNFRGGLSVDVVDQFLKSHNPRSTSEFAELDKFQSNYFSTVLRYELGDRTLLRLDYGHYGIQYTSVDNDFRNRADNAVAAYVYYKLRSRLAVFGEYEYIRVRYEQNVLSDSTEHNVFAGLRWDITAKSKGVLKVGYGLKNFENPALAKHSGLIVEAQLDHQFTPKRSIQLTASRKMNETDIATTDFIISDKLRAVYTQRLATKISGTVDLSYTDDKYQDVITIGSETKKLRNKYYNAGVALRYDFRDWLKFDAGYSYAKRISNFPDLDYVNKTIFFRLTATL